MPSKSPEQARLMRAVAHGWHKPGGGGPSQKVAKEFVAADKHQGYAGGGNVNNKGYAGEVQMFAQGGPVLGRSQSFVKTEDRFRGRPNPPVVKTDDTFEGGKPKGRDKSLTPVKPRS